MGSEASRLTARIILGRTPESLWRVLPLFPLSVSLRSDAFSACLPMEKEDVSSRLPGPWFYDTTRRVYRLELPGQCPSSSSIGRFVLLSDGTALVRV